MLALKLKTGGREGGREGVLVSVVKMTQVDFKKKRNRT
jgi:hypothetical protein